MNKISDSTDIVIKNEPNFVRKVEVIYLREDTLL
jgi:hypothetical protein